MGDIILSGGTTSGSGGGGDGAIEDGVDSSIKATVFDYPDSNPLAVITVDTNGDPVSASGGVNRTVTDTVNGFTDTVIDVTDAQSLTIFITTADLNATIQAQVSMTPVGTELYLAQTIYETSFNALSELETATAVVMTGGGAFRTFMMVVPPGARLARLHVTVYTSGTGALALFASSQFHNTVAALLGTDTTIGRSGLMIAGGNSSGAPRIPIIEAFSTYGRFTPGLVTHIASGDNAAAPVSAKLTDGTNPVAVKAASTAAVATDPALVVAVSPNNTIATSAAGNTAASGSITANGQSVQISVPPGGGGVGIQITGVFVGQIDFQASLDNVTWFSVNTSNGISSVNATSGTGIFILAASGYGYVRTIATAWTSGTATILMNGSVGAGPVLLSSPLPQGANILGKVGIDQTTPGTTNKVSLGADVVAVSATSLPLPTGAATLAEQQTQTASLSVIDDWDESDRAKVNPIVGQAGVAAGTGVDGATVQRVTLATNVPLPAGTNNIGDVDVLTVPAPLNVVGGGAEATALRVTVANDSTGVLSIDDNGGSLTVDQGNAGTNAQAWWTRIGDATTGPVVVTPSSTAAVIADKALVVSESPNSRRLSAFGTISAPSATASIDLVGIFSLLYLQVDTSGWKGSLTITGLDMSGTYSIPVWVMPLAGPGEAVFNTPLTSSVNKDNETDSANGIATYAIDTTNLRLLTVTSSTNFSGSVDFIFQANNISLFQVRPVQAGTNHIGETTAAGLVGSLKPEYFDEETQPLSLTREGLLRVSSKGDREVSELVALNRQIVSALLLLLNQMSPRAVIKLKDLTLN